MRRLLGLPMLLAAGCAVPPDGAPPPAPRPGPALQAPLPPKASLSARVGIEFLPEHDPTRPDPGPWPEETPFGGWRGLSAELGALGDQGSPAPGPRGQDFLVEPAHPSSPPAAGEWPPEEKESRSELPWLSLSALEKIEDPYERLTLHFLNNLLGQDRRRVERRFGAPVLFNRWRNLVPVQGLENQLDERDREDQELVLSRASRQLVSRPFRRALRKSTFIRTFGTMIDDFKASIPFTGQHAERTGDSWGRFSFKLRPTRDDNQFEVAYVLHGVRVGTGLERLKISYDAELTEDLFFSVRSHYYYDLDRFDLAADVHYEVDRDTRVHLFVGDRLDIVGGGLMYPVIHSPTALGAIDESLGAMFYVEHLF